MFARCASLAQAPQLPATTLADECYAAMFDMCANLTQAPELPATTLTDGCYSQMFRECTSLKQAPELPATQLTEGCYENMFEGCSSLTEIRVRFTSWDNDTHETQSTHNWLIGVSPNGTFICPEGLPKEFGEDRIREGWKVIKN